MTTRKFSRTRFSGDGQSLLYARVDDRSWSFFHMDAAQHRDPARVGPLYATRAELLADAERYAREFGFAGDSVKRMPGLCAGGIERERAALLAVAHAVLAWARTPQDHGGNPYCKDFVRLAEKAVAMVKGEKDGAGA